MYVLQLTRYQYVELNCFAASTPSVGMQSLSRACDPLPGSVGSFRSYHKRLRQPCPVHMQHNKTGKITLLLMSGLKYVVVI